MKPKVRHIIWDFNGTLLQDVELALSIDNRLLHQMGMEPITLEEYRTFMRNPVELFYQDFNDLLVDPAAKGLGQLRDDRMRATVQFVDKAFGLQGKVKAQDAYTNDLLAP